MKALLLAAAALLAFGPAAAYGPSAALAAAGEAFPAGNFCGEQRLALDGAQGADGVWTFGLVVANNYPVPTCTWGYVFEGPLDTYEGGCLAQAAQAFDDFPLVLCLGPAPAVAGTLEVRVCWAGYAPCTVEEAFLAGDLVAVRG